MEYYLFRFIVLLALYYLCCFIQYNNIPFGLCIYYIMRVIYFVGYHVCSFMIGYFSLLLNTDLYHLYLLLQPFFIIYFCLLLYKKIRD